MLPFGSDTITVFVIYEPAALSGFDSRQGESMKLLNLMNLNHRVWKDADDPSCPSCCTDRDKIKLVILSWHNSLASLAEIRNHTLLAPRLRDDRV